MKDERSLNQQMLIFLRDSNLDFPASVAQDGTMSPRQATTESLLLMRAIDEEYLQHPYYGRLRMAVAMKKQGFLIGQTAVKAAMRVMGLEAIYPKPNLSVAHKEHKKFPSAEESYS